MQILCIINFTITYLQFIELFTICLIVYYGVTCFNWKFLISHAIFHRHSLLLFISLKNLQSINGYFNFLFQVKYALLILAGNVFLSPCTPLAFSLLKYFASKTKHALWKLSSNCISQPRMQYYRKGFVLFLKYTVIFQVQVMYN